MLYGRRDTIRILLGRSFPARGTRRRYRINYWGSQNGCPFSIGIRGDVVSRSKSPKRSAITMKTSFRVEHPAIRLLTAGAWRGGGPLYLPAAHRWCGAGRLDVHPGRCAFAACGFFSYHGMAARTAAVGMDQVGDPHAPAAGIQVGLPVLPGHTARHCRRAASANAAPKNTPTKPTIPN